jgi:hypothetical protein
MPTIHDNASPIEVWLTQQNMTVTCQIVHEDESIEALDVDSLSMRGAQREITGWLIDQGYKPDGRWITEAEDDRVDYGPSETWRRFKLVKVDGADASGAPDGSADLGSDGIEGGTLTGGQARGQR